MIKKIIRKSLKISWTNPLLWIFGFFASYLLTNEIILFLNVPWQISVGVNPSPVFFQFIISFKNLLFNENIVISDFLKIIGSLFLFWIIPFILATWAEIVIFKNAKRKNKNINFSIKDTFSKFWPVFLINFLLILVNDGSILLINLLTSVLSGFIFWLVILLLLLIELILFLITKFVLCFIILENKKIISAIKDGILFFKKNWQTVFYLLLILFVLNILFTIIINLIAVGGFSPFSIISTLISEWGSYGYQILFYTGLIIVGSIVLILWSFFFSFQIIIWPVLFLYNTKN
ncbi:MAG: hypothetical protein BWY03_00525 [Parcubacteria group bacterium ADurb.Bin159]|jgi:hypothetical protein|nr:MAG: hypothetical protein BWY03_00525 [Parcubacteria group bacterium ADurb.Bin159]